MKHREIVSDALSKLTQTYLLLVRKWLGLRKNGWVYDSICVSNTIKKGFSRS